MAEKKTPGEEIREQLAEGEPGSTPDNPVVWPTADPPPKPVHEVWSDVMNDILALAKTEQHAGGGGNFMYRGIDPLMNVCGPVFRKHRVMVIPAVKNATYRDVQTSNGRPSREVTVLVEYAIYGPAGDVMFGTSAGESMDYGDKGTAKAMSVALRVFLLQSLCLPTDAPDPDSEAFQRSASPTQAQLAQNAANGLPDAVAAEQVMGVKRWCDERGLLTINVNDADGNSRPLGVLLDEKIDELDPTIRQQREGNVAQALGGS